MQTINLDLSVRSVVPLLHAKQGDVGRKFKAVLTDNRTAYPVPPGAAVSVWYSGASGAGNYTDIGAESAVSVSGNEITVELITQMLTNPGAGVVCLVLSTADGDELGMWNINYCVEPRPGMNSVAAQEYYTAFSQAVANLPYPDASLSIAGKAADAKAVGDALDQKQPKGTYLDVTDKTLLLSGAAADAKAVGDALATKTPIGLNTRSIMVTDTSGPGSLEAQIDSIFQSMTNKTAEFVQIKRNSGVDVSIGGSGSFWQCLVAKESATYGSIIAVQYPTSSSNFVNIQTRGLRNGTWGNWRAITTNDTILTSANWSDFINVSSGGTTTSGIVREFDTGLIDSQTYTTTGNKAKSYNVTVNNGGWHSIVVDYKCVQANNGTAYFSYYTSSGQKQLKVTINSDKTVTFDAQSGGKIKHIGGYY